MNSLLTQPFFAYYARPEGGFAWEACFDPDRLSHFGVCDTQCDLEDVARSMGLNGVGFRYFLWADVRPSWWRVAETAILIGVPEEEKPFLRWRMRELFTPAPFWLRPTVSFLNAATWAAGAAFAVFTVWAW